MPDPAPSPAPPADPAPPTGFSLAWHLDRAVCIACGELLPRGAERCPTCHQDQGRDARQKLAAFAGNWFVFDPQRPVPGVRLDLLVRQAQRGNLRPTAIVRGPTTNQQWRFVGETPGLSHLVGLCWACGGAANGTQRACPACGATFEAPAEAGPAVAVATVAPAGGAGEVVGVAQAVAPAAVDTAKLDADFAQLLGAPSSGARRTPLSQQPLNPLLLVAALVAVAFAVGIGIYHFRSQPALPPLPAVAQGTPAARVPAAEPGAGQAQTASGREPTFFGLGGSEGPPTGQPPANGGPAPANGGAAAKAPDPALQQRAARHRQVATRYWKAVDQLEKSGSLSDLQAAGDLLQMMGETLPAECWPAGLQDRYGQIVQKLNDKQNENIKFMGQ